MMGVTGLVSYKSLSKKRRSSKKSKKASKKRRGSKKLWLSK